MEKLQKIHSCRQVSTKNNFVVFVLDGRKSFPINHGKTSKDTFLQASGFSGRNNSVFSVTTMNRREYQVFAPAICGKKAIFISSSLLHILCHDDVHDEKVNTLGINEIG